VCVLLLDLLELILEKIFRGDALRMYYLDLTTGVPINVNAHIV
jgi:hypothetical protein